MVPYIPPAVVRSIPMIDLGPSFGASVALRREVAWEVHKACRETGFFLISNHGVSAALVASQFEFSKRFFDMPIAARQRLHMANSPTHAGYEPIGGQTLDSDTPPDLKESFYVNQDLPDVHPYVQVRLRGYGGNLWPDLPGFRQQMLAYYAAMDSLARHLMQLLALSLDLEARHFERYFECPSATLIDTN